MTDHWSKRYAREVAKQMNISVSALAKLADISSTTLTRALNNPNHKHNIGRETLDKIAAASGISYAPFRDEDAGLDVDVVSAEEFDARLARLSPSRRQAVLQYLADQEALHAQAQRSPDADDKSVAS